MNEREKTALQYRFSGYQLPLIQLDETGPSYAVLQPHPYYYSQPAYWKPGYLRYTPDGRIAMSSQTFPMIPIT